MTNKQILIAFIAMGMLAACNSKKNNTQNADTENSAGKYDYLIGTYNLVDPQSCGDGSMTLTIKADNGNYTYQLKTPAQNVEGKVEIIEGDCSVILELPDVKFAEYKGAIPEDKSADEMPNLQEMYGVSLMYSNEDGTPSLSIQNYGNEMNYYVIFKEFDCKYLFLEKN